MNDEDGMSRVSELLESLFSDIQLGKMQKENNLSKGWKKVLQHVPVDGDKLAAHSRVLELKNTLLCLETDHPGWIQLFYLHRKKIIQGLKREFPTLEIRDFSFTLKGQKIERSTGLRDITIEEHEAYLDKRDEKNKGF